MKRSAPLCCTAVALSEIASFLSSRRAGSGKTNTLAHRVAHLIMHGADPRRILLMAPSHAVQALKYVQTGPADRPEVLGDKAAAFSEGLNWAGTFIRWAPGSSA